MSTFSRMQDAIYSSSAARIVGGVKAIVGLTLTVGGLEAVAGIGSRCRAQPQGRDRRRSGGRAGQ